MRVAVLNHHGRIPGGSERSLLRLFTALQDEVDAEFVLFERGPYFDQVVEVFGHAHYVPMGSAVATSTRNRASVRAVFETISLIFRLAATLRTLEVDLVLTNSMKAHVAGTLAAFLARLPCLNYLHDMPEGRALQLTRVLSRYLARSRVATSQAVAEHFGLPKTTVVRPSIQLESFRSLPAKADARSSLGLPMDGLPIVSLVGRIARWKGQDRFIRIAAHVRARHDARFLIVGGPIFGVDDQYLPELHDLVAQLGLSDRLHFISWTDDLRNVYAATDVAVNCSRREPFGVTTLEALASGVPSVCFNDGGTPEAMTPGISGTAVAFGDEGAFGNAILAYLNSPENLRGASEAALNDALRFDVATLAREFKGALYSSVAL